MGGVADGAGPSGARVTYVDRLEPIRAPDEASVNRTPERLAQLSSAQREALKDLIQRLL